MTWDSVVGQHALTTTLRNAIATGKVAHAYLFCGPRGVGKTTCARIFARSINCMSPTAQGEACGECESCKAFEEGRSYNIHELDAASNNSVDDIRLLNEQVRMQPQVGKYKVFIIDEVHMLSPSAFNAFLKTLEEPPAHAVFVLATTERHKILATILSRCQIYDFNRMEVDDIVGHLKHVAEREGYTYEEEALGVIARKADGGMRDALSIFDQVAGYAEGNITYEKVIEDLNILDYEYYFELVDKMLNRDVSGVMVTTGKILEKGFDGSHLMSGLASHFRDLLMSKDAKTLPLLEIAGDVRDRYAEQGKKCPVKFLYKALKLCNDCDQGYRTATNKRLLVELTLIQVAQALDDDEAGCGRSPKKILNPIFDSIKKILAVEAKPSTTSQKTPIQGTAATITTPTQNKGFAQSSPVSTMSTAKATRRGIPQPISIKAKLKNQSEQELKKAPIVVQSTQVTEFLPIDEGDLNFWWYRYAMQLPQEENAVAGRLKNMRPQLINEVEVDVPVENEHVMKYMNEQAQALQDFLRVNLRNGALQLNFRLIKDSEKKYKAYTKREQLALMLEKNSAFMSLAKELNLELG